MELIKKGWCKQRFVWISFIQVKVYEKGKGIWDKHH